MKVEEVPHDLKYYDGYVVRDVAYAVDKDGQYQEVVSEGWTPKNDALEITFDAINEECEEILRRVKNGETSLLEYYAAKNLMPINLLSDYSGISKRTIKKHFNPKVFDSLDKEILERYADVLRITVEQLTKTPK